ncbi:MAG: hypothetical protein QN229_02495 [Desulfurococcaceae archaeon TW002]
MRRLNTIKDFLVWVVKKAVLLLGLFVFYAYGFLWIMKPRKAETMNELLDLFYYKFLRLKKKHVEVVRISDDELVTISRNSCPILRLTLFLGLDTRYTCKLISEPVCRYVLKRVNPKLIFERNYDYIRPYKDGCMERIYLKT